jgi:phosphoribosylaminoimidazolecarboxamide formyltransferase / IMP cyclohydrolase
VLARRTDEHLAELKAQAIVPIDLVVCNLYPFVETVRQAGATESQIIEEIDIGGVTLLRAAAKNHESVLVVSDPADYSRVAEALAAVESSTSSTALRRQLALKAFRCTAAYDAAISAWFAQQCATDVSSSTNDDKQKTAEVCICVFV